MSGTSLSNLGEKGMGRAFVGNRGSNGDEFALFDFTFECDFFFERGERATAIIAAAGGGGGDHRSLIIYTTFVVD